MKGGVLNLKDRFAHIKRAIHPKANNNNNNNKNTTTTKQNKQQQKTKKAKIPQIASKTPIEDVNRK